MEIIKKNLRTYKDLTAWQKAYQLCLKVFNIVKTFPKEEIYGLTSQMKRCALSVPSNIAEGYTRPQTPEYIRFLYIAYASLAELETQLMIAKDLGYLNIKIYDEIINLQNEVQRIMYGLIKSLKIKSQILKS